MKPEVKAGSKEYTALLPVRFRSVKPEIRILGICSVRPKSRTRNETDLIGVVYKGGELLDGVLRGKVKVDGFDATGKIVRMVSTSSHRGQIRLLILPSLLLAGLNPADINLLYRKLHKPVIAIAKRGLNTAKARLERMPGGKKKLKVLDKAGTPTSLKLDGRSVSVYLSGVTHEDAREILKVLCPRSDEPEPLRIACMLARAITDS